MDITFDEEDIDIGDPYPITPFIARQYNCVSGALCIVASNCTMSGHYNVMFLDGRGGPAQGDVWNCVPYDKIRNMFIPIRTPVTFKNKWPRP